MPDTEIRKMAKCGSPPQERKQASKPAMTRIWQLKQDNVLKGLQTPVSTPVDLQHPPNEKEEPYTACHIGTLVGPEYEAKARAYPLADNRVKN